MGSGVTLFGPVDPWFELLELVFPRLQPDRVSKNESTKIIAAFFIETVGWIACMKRETIVGVKLGKSVRQPGRSRWQSRTRVGGRPLPHWSFSIFHFPLAACEKGLSRFRGGQIAGHWKNEMKGSRGTVALRLNQMENDK